jgi:hypothetical protein
MYKSVRTVYQNNWTRYLQYLFCFDAFGTYEYYPLRVSSTVTEYTYIKNVVVYYRHALFVAVHYTQVYLHTRM